MILIYPWDIKQIDEIIDISLSVLIKSKLIYKTKTGLFRKLNGGRKKLRTLPSFKQTM